MIKVGENFIRRAWNSPTLMTWGNLFSASIKLVVLTPLILIKYDVNEIAFWYLLLTINSLAIVLDFGFYPTFSRVITYAFNGLSMPVELSSLKQDAIKGNPSWGFMERIYGTQNVIYLIITAIIFIGTFLVTYFPVERIILRTENQQVLWVSYVIFVFSVVIGFLSRKFDAVIIGTNHVALINRWNILNNLLNSIISIIIVSSGLGIEWLIYNQLFFALLLFIRNYFLERHICDKKIKNFIFFSFDKEIFSWIWRPVWQSGTLILTSTGVTQMTGLIYSTMASSTQLASYLLTLKLVTVISQFSQAPFYSKLPVFSGLRVQGKITKLAALTSNSMLKSLMVFVLGISGLFTFGNFFLEHMKSNSNIESARFIVFMAFIWFLERHHAMHAQIYVTTNKIPFYKTAIATAIINISLMYILVPKMGVWGFPTAIAISNLSINNWWNVKISLKSINQPFWKFFSKSALIPLLVLVFLSFVKLYFFN